MAQLGLEKIDLAEGGWLLYHEYFLPVEEADRYFLKLRFDCSWEQKPGLFGHKQPRLTAAHGDNGVCYCYSGTRNLARPWTVPLFEIKQKIEQVEGQYNFCLLNLYRHGRDSMGLHADDEPEMGPMIASLSLGALRTFRIRHNTTRETRNYRVAHGTLIIMGGTMQQFWKHEVPKTSMPVGERINLTFRQIGDRCSSTWRPS